MVAASPVSFVGVLWSSPVSKPISFLDLRLALFGNGGWFGANGVDPGAGGLLTADHLVEPRVEVTTDGGTTWSVIAHNPSYVASLTGQAIGGGTNPNPNPVTVTFALTQPAVNIHGIRLVGTTAVPRVEDFWAFLNWRHAPFRPIPTTTEWTTPATAPQPECRTQRRRGGSGERWAFEFG